MKQIVIFILMISVLRCTPTVHAVTCTGIPSIGNSTLSNCTLTVTAITGADYSGNIEVSTQNSAVLHLDAGASITINTGGKLTTGSVVLDGGTIAIASGGTLNPGFALYVLDADADGWASSFDTLYLASASGRRRLSLMRSPSTTDCGDANYNIANQCCSANGSACSSDGACCSSICGTNTDGDNFFSLTAAHTGTCQASSLAYTDCYDNNVNAYPGSAYCSSVHRGDGSFDYNCGGTNVACGTIATNSCTLTASCYNERCGKLGNPILEYLSCYAGASAACGTVGCVCTGTATYCTNIDCGTRSCQNAGYTGCTAVSTVTQSCN